MKLRDLIPNLDKPAVSGSLDTEITSLAYDSRNNNFGLFEVILIDLKGNSTDFLKQGRTIENLFGRHRDCFNSNCTL